MPETIGAGFSPAFDLNKQKLASVVNDASRHVTLRGNSAIVPLKFDKKGNPVKGFDRYKRLDLEDFRFLDAWRSNDWDSVKAGKDMGLTVERVAALVRKLSVFKDEDAIMRSKAKIPGPAYVISKDLDNVEKAIELDDSQHKSLERLAKVNGMFKTSEVNITQNVFNLPRLTPEATAAIKAIADKEADVVDAEISNG